MDTYVGFLPSHALEHLLEKSPIVLLTLAKRLISLLSPLGMFPSFVYSKHHIR
jgi:lysophospholipid hydrolase